MSESAFSLTQELFQIVTVIKVLTAIGMVLGLAFLAEYSCTRMAGFLSGYPMGAAIAIFFVGLDLGP